MLIADNFQFPETVSISASSGIESTTLMALIASKGISATIFHANFRKPCSITDGRACREISRTYGHSFVTFDAGALTDLQASRQSIDKVFSDEADVKDYEDQAFSDENSSPSDSLTGFFALAAIAAYHSQLVGASATAFGLVAEQQVQRPGVTRGIASLQECINALNGVVQTHSLLLPFIGLRKAQVIELGSSIGADYTRSFSCTRSGPIHCGKCAQCTHRKLAFAEARISDPTTYDA